MVAELDRPSLNYKVFGEGEPVVILHGFMGMLDNWQTFAKALAEHYMVYIVDQRDHGRSPHTTDFSYPLLAQDIKHFLDENWLYEARFIGHSMGGKTLLQLATQEPDYIQSMVIVDMGIKAYPGGHEIILKALNEVPIDTLTSRGQADEILAQYIEDWGVRQFLLKNLTRRKPAGYAWKMNLPLLTEHYPAILKAVDFDEPCSVPTLFVRGEQSGYITEADLSAIESSLPHSQMASIDAGHWIHAEKPKELLTLVSDFFDQ